MYDVTGVLPDLSLQSRESELISTAGIRTPEELLTVMWSFPSLARHGIDFPKLSNAAMMAASNSRTLAAVRQAGRFGAPPPAFGHGAMHPVGAAAPPGYSVPFTVGGGSTGPAASGGGPGTMQPGGTPPAGGTGLGGTNYDFRCPSWPVRDQGLRGTCVAFATTACHEHLLNCTPDLSEQFLYWAIKVSVGDPWPSQDGTLIDYARQALASDGQCLEHFWPYFPSPIPGNVSQMSASEPSAAAKADAATRLHSGAFYQTSGGAAAVLSALQSRQRPVAISVPVFKDPMMPQSDNWNTALGQLYGRVFDPPQTSVADGGHAVCITGFQSDPSEPLGGWFIVRNSWGSQSWGSQLPDPSYVGPEPGYGQISATYVDKYLWELMSL
jgi:hypothetical protein